MKPVLWSLGPVQIYSFGFFVALGVLVSLFLMNRQARKGGFPNPDQVFDLVFMTIVGGFVGARLLYVIQMGPWYLEHPLEALAFWQGGLIFYGGVIGSLVALFFFTRAKKISYFTVLDFLLPYVALTHAFGRIGCFLNGCCYGRFCPFPWGVVFPGHEQAVHPAQLYEAAFTFGLFFSLQSLYPKRRFEGQITALYFLCYALGRFVIEFWRADNPAAGPLTVNQWESAALFFAAAILYKIKSHASARN